ncbi:MAG: hypothetical protein KAJ62_06890 [Desulfobacteraceae bacterium]|nr:hypothetical protein [Desulfobacteraceae bacterium]
MQRNLFRPINNGISAGVESSPQSDDLYSYVLTISSPKNLKPAVNDYYPCAEYSRSGNVKDINANVNRILI